MIVILSLLAQALHIGLMIAAAPTAAGLTHWLDARLTGRDGPPILAPWRDLIRLSRKTPLAIESESIVSRFAPALALGATLSAAALVPSFAIGMALSPLADALLIVSLMTLARIATALAAFDSGTALPGLAQQASSARAVLAEPALMLVLLTLALMAGSFNLDVIVGQQQQGVLLPAAASAVALTALVALVMADIGADDQGTDETFGGMDLAMIRSAGWLRRLIWIDLAGALFLPVGIANTVSGPLSWLIGLAAWAAKLAAVTLAMAGLQALFGRIPNHGRPGLISLAALLALLAVIMVLASTRMA